MWSDYLFVICSFLFAVDGAHGLTCTAKSCRVSIQSVRPVCGTDGFTYPNVCILELAQCYDANLAQRHKGPCRKQASCNEHNKSANSIVRPRCRNDGNYASGQCSNTLGYCWCVTGHGIPIEYTMSQYSPDSKQRCGKKKKNNKRRSSPRTGRKAGRPCKREDKAKFNLNLVKIFQTEWQREGGVALPTEDDAFRLVLDWKFQQMDKNNDDQLDKTEYRDLKRIVKKAVKPKRCAKSFAKACDMNRDQYIGKTEWADCLTRDGIDDRGGKDDSDADEDDEDVTYRMSPSTLTPPHVAVIAVLQPEEKVADDSSESREEDAVDCRSDRQTALSEMRAHTKNDLYVPECTPDGRYQKIQCYKSTGYCWCVHEDTGKNIPGTSVKNAIPKCDQIASSVRLLKGCPEEKKREFLKALIEFLHERMTKELNGSSIASANRPAWNTTKEEQVASWSFVIFDKNKNKILDKNEWKYFKDTVMAIKHLRKCGKKLPRYCDKNKDRGITLTEWLECLQKRDPYFTEILRED